jgi:hypothetical protein
MNRPPITTANNILKDVAFGNLFVWLLFDIRNLFLLLLWHFVCFHKSREYIFFWKYEVKNIETIRGPAESTYLVLYTLKENEISGETVSFSPPPPHVCWILQPAHQYIIVRGGGIPLRRLPSVVRSETTGYSTARRAPSLLIRDS